MIYVQKNKVNDALTLKPIDQVDKDKIKSEMEKLLASHGASIEKLCDKNSNLIKEEHVTNDNTNK